MVCLSNRPLAKLENYKRIIITTFEDWNSENLQVCDELYYEEIDEEPF